MKSLILLAALLLTSTASAQGYIPVPDFNGGVTYRRSYTPYYSPAYSYGGYYGSRSYQNYELRRIRYTLEDAELGRSWRGFSRPLPWR